MKVNMVTPWERKCGNAEYAKWMVERLEKEVRVRVVEINKPESKNPLEFYRLAKESNRDCDVIHVQHGYALFGKVLFSGIYSPVFYFFLDRKKRVITTFHDVGDFDRSGFSGFARILFRSFVDFFIFRFSHVLHVHTRAAKKFLVANGADEGKIVVAPLGMFVKPVFIPKEECKERLSLAGKKILTMFGFVHRNKGHDLAIEALSRINENVVLLIAGESKHRGYKRKLEEKVRRLGLERRVIFQGYVSEENMPVIFNATDLAILPYRKITQSSVLNLLVAYGLPVLSSDLSVFKEVKEDYNCIETFKAGSSSDMSEKIAKLISDEKRVEELKRNSEEYIRERSSENIIKAVLEMYREKGE